MSATAKHCKAEICFLRSLPSPFGTERAVLEEELVRVLAGRAQTNEHATRIIRQVLDEFKMCPTPAELADICRQIDPDPKGLPDPCARCRADGGYWVQQQAIKNEGFGQQEYHYSGRCNCKRGKELARRDKDPRLGNKKASDYLTV